MGFNHIHSANVTVRQSNGFQVPMQTLLAAHSLPTPSSFRSRTNEITYSVTTGEKNELPGSNQELILVILRASFLPSKNVYSKGVFYLS